ncbi:dihydrolipoyl dehydrogenase [Candidatus Woesearchaeota archaeon]|nr:dihydrolipoyl dehydrogenase [Candidatus Woesearchaeota archaeon]
MKNFDVIVIGAGSGLNISSATSSRGLKTAIVEKGHMGGTCLNRGCIPSKIIIHSADVAETINNAKSFGINAKGFTVDFKKVTERASKIVDEDAKSIEEGIRSDKDTVLFKTEGRFIGYKTLKVGNKAINGDKIIIAAGTRPFIPPIEGLDKVGYMTSDEALRLTIHPKSLTIIGGGYIAAELAHFYGALGTKINIIQRRDVLIPNEDGEIAEKFTKIFSKKYNIFLNSDAIKVSKKGDKIITTIKNRDNNKNKLKNIVSDKLLIAAGRIPNTDILDVAKTGVKTDKNGFIKMNKYMETTAKDIWALGDICGIYLFKHSANLEAQYVYYNAFGKHKKKVDYSAMPHAIFSSPQIAGVGYTEEQLKEKKIPYLVGRKNYIETAMGTALNDKEGFVKMMIDKKTREILGCHILGTDASTLIHEVIIAMKANQTVDILNKAVHIHPALSEVVQRAVWNIW